MQTSINNNQKQKEPVKVLRLTKSKVQFISGQFDQLQERYDKFVFHIQSYGGTIHGSTFQMSAYPVIAVFYSVPVNVSDALIKEGLEQQ